MLDGSWTDLDIGACRRWKIFQQEGPEDPILPYEIGIVEVLICLTRDGWWAEYTHEYDLSEPNPNIERCREVTRESAAGELAKRDPPVTLDKIRKPKTPDPPVVVHRNDERDRFILEQYQAGVPLKDIATAVNKTKGWTYLKNEDSVRKALNHYCDRHGISRPMRNQKRNRQK
jgi:hypothetical protein